ncbi:MAG: T9SS type A sorting domain-containing protein, partial [Calditrichales bacterium]
AGYQDPGYDPLAYTIEEAHKRGIEVHAWFNVFQTSERNASLVPLPPAAAHPEWICRDINGNPMPAKTCLSPGLEAVRNYTVDVAMEIVNNYDVDGLHLDYVRWNEYTTSSVLAKPAPFQREIDQLDGMLTPEQEENLILYPTDRYLWDAEHPESGGIPAGFDSWEDWWRDGVTMFVKALHDSIQAVKPWVRLSPAALGKFNWSGWNGYNVVFQDAAGWFNKGYVDQLTPMHYHWLTADGFYGMLEGDDPSSWSASIQEGIAAGRLFTVGPGSYRFDEDKVWNNHPSVINRCRQLAWTDGFQFFSYGSWYKHQYWEEAGSTFFGRKTKVRAAKYMWDATPEAPRIALNKIDSLNYELTVSPNNVLDTDHWFAIYRSEDDDLNLDTDEIVRIGFGQSGLTYTDSFDGLQNFDGQYRYFATMLDRVWNESAASGASMADPLPSFAPQVVNTLPMQTDTVVINTGINLTFSKSIEISTLAGQITFDPAVTVVNYRWTDNNRHLQLTLQSNLEFGTNYTLTVSAAVTDVNGTALDGNGDGEGGDDFVLQFRTFDVDNQGPRMLFSYPGMITYENNFIIDDVLNLAFDELIDPVSVDENSIILSDGVRTFTSKSKVFSYTADRSVIGVQPAENLDPAKEYEVLFTHAITDTSGNAMDSSVTLYFETQPYMYSETKMIEDFTGSGVWQRPGYSGSTNGIEDALSYFRITGVVYIPAAKTPFQRKSGEMHYVWNPVFLEPAGSAYLLREYLAASAPKYVTFDTTYILQCYIFGDGSGNDFRFSLSENNGSGYPLEVSQWVNIDWVGWKMIEWDLGDPNSVGSWLGNAVLDGTSYFIDSFQMTHQEGDAMSGTLYFKNLRLVKKEYNIIGGIAKNSSIPVTYQLSQNYPNPFNPSTQITFMLSQPGLTRLTVYDILGRKVKTLLDKELISGEYSISFDGADLATGVYIYELRSGEFLARKKMTLIK